MTFAILGTTVFRKALSGQKRSCLIRDGYSVGVGGRGPDDTQNCVGTGKF